MTVLKNETPGHSKSKSLVRSVFYNCLALVVIFTLCLYGLGLLGLYMRWFILEAPPPNTPTPIIVTVVIPTDPGSHQEPIIITVVATRPPENEKPPTATLEPTPTQWWPPTASPDIPATRSINNYPVEDWISDTTGTLHISPEEVTEIPFQPQWTSEASGSSTTLVPQLPETSVTPPF